ncbi:hypothetical protein QAD02_009962 [Eretmocerus hayati]|uniref:Uncharacterized protein n=1 Tax=Eretmocerus hayati TaxID=131215 RepID=A0ACC2ND71_9HYME|nr:hypothetical protein QAD02_009962 [Eretmocerus hayati]
MEILSSSIPPLPIEDSRCLSNVNKMSDNFSNVVGELGEIKPAKIGFTWKLKNFEKYYTKANLGDSSIASPTFCMLDHKHRWSTIFRVGYHMSGVNGLGEEVNHTGTDHMKSFGDYTWSCHHFIDVDKFISPETHIFFTYLRIKNVCLTIFCEGFGAGSCKLPSRQELWQPAIYGALSKAFTDFSSLYEDRRMADFAIHLDDGSEISVHKLILSARSPVFAAMFEHDMSETRNNFVHIEGVRRVVMEKLLHYVYCGIIKNIDDINLELLVIADKYELKNLRDVCEVSMLDCLTIDIVSELLVIADMYQLEILKQKAIVFINKNAKKVIKTKNYKNVVAFYPDVIVHLFENQDDDADVPDDVSVPMVEYSSAEQAFFTYDDLRRDFAASDRKPEK